MFLLDTNVISELRKPRPHGGVVSWAQAYSSVWYNVPAIVLLELQAGAEATRRQDAVKAAEIERWIASISSTFSVIPLDGRAGIEAAKMMAGRSPELLADAMIAATAKVHSLTVATRNLRDFAGFGIPLVNPFEFRP